MHKPVSFSAFHLVSELHAYHVVVAEMTISCVDNLAGHHSYGLNVASADEDEHEVALLDGVFVVIKRHVDISKCRTDLIEAGTVSTE